MIKMMDMGIGTDYISRVLFKLKDATKFDVEKLKGFFSSLSP